MELLNQPCPSFFVLDIDRRPVQSSDFRERWLWLVFHRHLA
jgi:predicted secreted protein